ncbi:thioredoxin [Candidatus Uhrbacteria bacterium]|nr:thioredoxin [Candidatus Uhrbacteria bacterium]
MPLTLTSQNFTQEVLQASGPVLVDFWAPWCGPCKVVGPIVEEVAKDLAGKLTVGKVNVDEQGDLAQQFNILSIPTFLIFKGGRVVEQFSGAVSKEQMMEKVSAHV